MSVERVEQWGELGSDVNKLGETAAKKEVIKYGESGFEDKNFSVVALYGSGYVSPRCIVLYGERDGRTSLGNGNGTWNDAIYGALLVGSIGDGSSICDLERFGKSLGKYDFGRSLYSSQHLSFN